MRTILLSFSFMLALTSQLSAQKSPVFLTSGVAAKGYDVVAYFTESKPVKGDPKITYHWQDADWQFSNQENLKMFKAEPQKYAPQYGGYCAYGCSKEHKAPTDPEAWTIVDGKLYLNYSLDVKKMWIKDTKSRIAEADANWPKIKDKS